MGFLKKTGLNINNILFPLLVTAFSVAAVFKLTNKILIVELVILVVLMAAYKKLSIGYQDVLLFLSSFLCYFVTSGLRTGLLVAVCFFSAFQLGKMTIQNGGTNEYGSYPVIVPATVLFIVGLINYSYLLRDPSIIQEHKDRWPDWSGQVFTRTGHDSFLVFMAALLVYFILMLIRKKKWAIIGIIAAVAAFTLSFIGRGREPFIVSFCTMVVVLAGIFIEKGLYKKRAFRIALTAFGVIVVVLVVSFAANAFGLRDYYEGSFLSGGGGILHNDRFYMMYYAAVDAIAHPWGNNTDALMFGDEEYRFAHNSWIECARSGGLVSFVLMVTFTISNFIDMVYCWAKSRNVHKYALIAGFIGITLLCAVEPIYPGNNEFWSIEVYLAGLLCGACDKLQGAGKEIRVSFRR